MSTHYGSGNPHGTAPVLTWCGRLVTKDVLALGQRAATCPGCLRVWADAKAQAAARATTRGA